MGKNSKKNKKKKADESKEVDYPDIPNDVKDVSNSDRPKPTESQSKPEFVEGSSSKDSSSAPGEDVANRGIGGGHGGKGDGRAEEVKDAKYDANREEVLRVMKQAPKAHYEVLNVEESATFQEIKAAYHRTIRLVHSDKVKDYSSEEATKRELWSGRSNCM